MDLPIEKPTLLLDVHKTRRNIWRMAEKARASGVGLRPHFKTHQSAVIGEWFREAGVEAITTSSVSMARYFARHGWSDITIAFPVNWLEIAAINELVTAVGLHLLVESVETALFLADAVENPVNVWLECDTGDQRTGIPWDDASALITVAEAVAGHRGLRLRGLLTHAGRSYRIAVAAVEEVYQETVQRLETARSALEAAGFTGLALSHGDTPTCTIVEDLSAVDEIRPGNFVFFDVTQAQAGVCAPDDIAIAMACPVVARYPAQGKVVLYGGAVHLSEARLDIEDGSRLFGWVALPAERGWGAPLPGAHVIALSQEHGQVHLPEPWLSEVQIGDLLLVLPVHSCLTANLRQRYVTLQGEVIEMAGIL